MYTLISAISEHLEAGHDIACATVIKQSGSSPRGVGAKLIADKNGVLIAGTVGGGLLEKQALAHCTEALASGRRQLLDIDLSNTLAADSGMICGGSIQILIEPFDASPSVRAHFTAMADALSGGCGDSRSPEKRTCIVVLTPLPDKRNDNNDDTQQLKYLLIEDDNGNLAPPDANAPAVPFPPEELYREHRCLPPASVLDINGRSWFAESFRPPWRMILLGGGHVSYFTAKIASIAGFEVCVMEDRPEFLSPDRFPQVQRILLDSFSDCFSRMIPDARTCVVIVTRGHMHDAVVLKQALGTRAGYIGMIGSKRKRAEIYSALLKQGIPQTRLDQVYSPIGLPIGAETPEEIAVSITAECIAFSRKKENRA